MSGFTTGAAIHVFTSQVKDLLGLELPRIRGNYKLIKVRNYFVRDFQACIKLFKRRFKRKFLNHKIPLNL